MKKIHNDIFTLILSHWSNTIKKQILTPGAFNEITALQYRFTDKIYSIEVKSGAAGKLRSMHQLLSEHPEIEEGLVI